MTQEEPRSYFPKKPYKTRPPYKTRRIPRIPRIRQKPQFAKLEHTAGKMNEIPGRCQCSSSCPNACIKGEAFCEVHLKSCERRAPLNGYEPEYDPSIWNKKKQVRLTHNCFSYAFNIIDTKQIEACFKNPSCYTAFHQPGSISGFPKFNDVDPKTCPNMISRMFGDNPNAVTPCKFEEKCPKGKSKIALVVDQDQDYHFLRQDAPTKEEIERNPNNPIGYFSQKSGSLPVTNKDAIGNKVFDVSLAYHNFIDKQRTPPLNYDILCGYFCVSRDKPLFVKIGGRRNYAQTRRR